MRKLREFSLRDLLTVGVPSLLLLGLGFWVAAQFIRPAPPDYLILSSGSDGGAYQLYAARYKMFLEKHGIELRERTSAGSVENLARLRDREQEVDVAFIQAGTAIAEDDDRLVALGGMYYEPLWVFYRGPREVTQLRELIGLRLAIGPEGSGTRKLALELLEANGMAAEPTRLLPIGGLDAVRALQEGGVDAVFVVGAPHSAVVWSLLYADGVRLMGFGQADAYTRRFPYLSKVVLPHGAIDLVRDIPPQDATLVAPVAMLVARKEMHPALKYLLLQGAEEVHGGPEPFSKAGDFPTPHLRDFPLASEADRYYKSGKPFLQRYLPFWAATLVDRMIVMLIPLVALLIPLMRVAPPLYRWQVSRRIYRWYGQLKFLENEVKHNPGKHSREEWLAQLARIEDGVDHIPTPLAFADQWYILREHIGLVRAVVLEKTPGPGSQPGDRI